MFYSKCFTDKTLYFKNIIIAYCEWKVGIASNRVSHLVCVLDYGLLISHVFLRYVFP